MDLTSQAVDKPRVVIVMTLLVLVIAIIAAFRIPVQRTPAINTAIVMVAVPFPGAQPTEAEDQITRKIEDALQRLDNVDFIASTSMRGSSVTQIIFRDGVDGDQARNDVEHLVNEVRRELPMGREVQPLINVIDFESAPIMLVTLSGPEGFDERALKQIAEDVQDELETIPGVANTQLFGGREREIHVNFNPDLLAEYGLSVEDLRTALSAFHAEMPGGLLHSNQYDLHVRNETKFRGVEDIRKAVVAEREGRLVRVEDVAEVQDTYRRLMNFAQLDGVNSATIIVNKEADINTLGAARAIKERVEQLGEQFPFIKFSCTRDISTDISTMFRVLGSDALFGAMVVLVILAWSMGIRMGLLVVTAIPVSSAVALVFLYFGGFAISNMVIFAFIVALGMVVDGAIIVTDAIYRRLEAGESAKDAAKNGAHEVAIPVFAADLTTIAAFLPMLLVPGIMGDFMGVLPIVVSMALAGSLIVDHFLVPVIAQYWFRNFDIRQHTERAQQTQDRVNRIWGPFYKVYGGLLDWALQNRTVVLLTCGCLIAWAFCMLAFGFIGFTFFPASDRGQFEISFELPLGYSIEETAKATERITDPLKELMDRGEVVHFVTAIGSSSALAARLDTDPAAGPEFGKVMVELVQPTDRDRHENEIIAELRKKIVPLPGMKYRIDQVEEGPPGGADVAVRFSGKDLDQLGVLGRELTEELQKVKGTVEARSDYRPDNPELVIEPHPAVVGLFGMTDGAVARAIQTAILGDTSILLSIDDEDVPLRLQAQHEHQEHIEDVTRLMVTAPNGRRATIGELADVRRGSGLFSVNRRDRRRAVVVSCDMDKQSDVIPMDVFAELRKDILPAMGFQPVKGNSMAFLGEPGSPAEGVRAEFTGENEEQAKGFNSLLRSMIIAVFLIFAIMVIEFNSFRQAMIVMFTVPLSFIGVVAGMWLCDFDFSLATFIGLVSLTGVVVNDAIVLVDFANEARRRGLGINDAVREAGRKRSRAVMLTMLTSVGGMLPTFFNIMGGGEFWIPLTGAMIFGLMFSAMLTLIVIPVCYSLAYTRGERKRLAAAAKEIDAPTIVLPRPHTHGDFKIHEAEAALP